MDCKFIIIFTYRKLNDDRKSLNHKIAHGLATRDELLKQIKVELNMLDTCQLKIDVRS